MTGVTTLAAVDAERAHWDAHADDRLAVWGEPDWDAGVTLCLDAVVPALTDVLAWPRADTAHILDLGCGPGRLTVPLARTYPQALFVGVDVSAAMTARAFNTAGPNLLNVTFKSGDGRTLDFIDDRTMDAAFSVLMFQHVPDDAVWGYLREVGRVLKVGGRFRFQFVVGDESSFLNRHRSVVDVDRWCGQAGLEIVDAVIGLHEPAWCWATAVKP